MARYTRDSEFWHDFADGMTAKIPWSKTTSTYRRAMKREQRKLENSHMGLDLESSHRIKESGRQETLEYWGADPMKKVRQRLRTEHPNWTNGQVLRYSRHQDPIGRKIVRMKEQGLDNYQIRDKLHLGKKGSKPSTGKMGH